ncbi:hypothetical protein [Ensifer sp. ZNC0028]|uniref:hypothetical protein n=1 Tax=Ensifer sp. ZNC0028 TaxID=1339236 RepID=UPI0012E0AF6D|nr:hypothetical protein [Ensifer sp. ZNC0028]
MARGHGTVSPREADYIPSIRRATLFLGFLYQLLQFVISNTLWASLEYAPFAFLPITLILMLSGTLMSYAIAAGLYRFRGQSILFKLLLGSALSLGAGAINAGVDFFSRSLMEHGDQGGALWTDFSYIVIYCTALFLGWTFLYIALLANFEVRERR